MTKLVMLQTPSRRWWGLPLLFALLLMPVASSMLVRLWIPEGYVYLIYLPLALMFALLMVFDWGHYRVLSSRYAGTIFIVTPALRRQ